MGSRSVAFPVLSHDMSWSASNDTIALSPQWMTSKRCYNLQDEHAAALEDRTATLHRISTQHASELEAKLEELKSITEAKVI